MIITTTMMVQLCAKLAALSSNQAGLTTSDFLSISNIEMMNLTSELLQARESYLTYTESVAVPAGQTSVRIPYRAVNGTIAHLWWEDGTGSRYRLGRNQIEDMEYFSTTATGRPNGFYVMGNSVVLLPTPSTTGSLVVAYAFRPNLLVDGTTCQTVTAVGSGTVNVSNIPSNFTSGIAYDLIDSLSGNGIVYYDQIANISGTTLTFPAGVPLAAVGNYIAQAGQSPVPMLPEEGHALLLETTLLRLEIIRGNANRIKAQTALVSNARKSWDMLLMNRIVSKASPSGGGGAQFPLRPY